VDVIKVYFRGKETGHFLLSAMRSILMNISTKRSLAHTQLRALSERQLYDVGLNRRQAEFDLC